MYYSYLTVLVLIAFISCKNSNKINTDSEKEVSNIYLNEEIGWQIIIPEGWEMVDLDDFSELNKKASGKLSEETGKDYNTSELKNLIGFKKNHSSFHASLEPFVEEFEGEFLIASQNLKDDLITTYESIGLTVESSEISTEEINGKEFYTYELYVYKQGKLILTQVNYDALIGDKLLGVIISYRDEEAKNVLLNAWRNSTFKK